MVPKPSTSAKVLDAVSTSPCCSVVVPRPALLLVIVTLPVGGSLTALMVVFKVTVAVLPDTPSRPKLKLAGNR